jgi:hypothetical protein
MSKRRRLTDSPLKRLGKKVLEGDPLFRSEALYHSEERIRKFDRRSHT